MGTEVKINGQFYPRNKDYSQYYTPLFRVKQTTQTINCISLKGVICFSVLRLTTSELKKKDFIAYFGTNSDADTTPKVMLYDLTEQIGSPYVACESKNGYWYVYARGGNTSDSISYQVTYAPYPTFFENLFDEDILVSSVTTPTTPSKYKSVTVTPGTSWGITSSKQRIYDTIFSRLDVDCYISTASDSAIVTDYVIATVSIKPKADLTLPLTWFNIATPTTTGICFVKILSSTGEVKVVSGVPKDSYIRLKLDYQFTI